MVTDMSHLGWDTDVKSWRDYLQAVKTGTFSTGEIMNVAAELEKALKQAYEGNKNKQTDSCVVNNFLLSVRYENW